jgi:hypothetical protein
MMLFLCAERRGRTPARSIVAALLARAYSRNRDYLTIKYSLFSVDYCQGARARSAFFFRSVLYASFRPQSAELKSAKPRVKRQNRSDAILIPFFSRSN